MEKRYYTPTVEEIYSDIELHYYDGKTRDGFFINPYVYRDNLQIIDICKEFKSEKFRVKYLDKDDIEEVLDVKQLKGDSIELNFQLPINDYLFYEFDYDMETMQLSVERFYQTKLVAKDTGEYVSHTIFQGVIKNKSELKKLMKQLQIN